MKTTIISILGATLLIVITLFLTSGGKSAAVSSSQDTRGAQIQNVTQEDGKQVIEIDAHGGYTPNASIAKAGVPTVLRMKTNNTFDCSSSVVIQSLGIRDVLPSSGIKDYPIPPQQPGSVLSGTCAMGMYNFQIQFE